MALSEGKRLVVRLPATIGAVRLARGAVADVPGLGRFEHLQFVAGLLTSELVTNAVRHAGLAEHDVVALLVETADGAVHVEVSDPGAGFFPLPHARARPGPQLEHGLHLVDMLADRWGFRRNAPGCCVWFDLDLVPGRRPWRGREPIPPRSH
jgi:anti-sigma regulatory factor (Ser/Thr protein kinase)